MVKVLVVEQCGNNDHHWASTKAVMEKDKVGPQAEFLNWWKANFNSIIEELTKVD